METEWTALSPEEKQKEIFESWLSPQGIEFVSTEAEKSYKERVTRIIDVIQLKVPDRVPVCPSIGFFPAYYAGITPEAAMYDYDKLCQAWGKYVWDFKPDTYGGASTPGPGKVYEILDYVLYKWPGHGTPSDTPYQCIEAEYMKADEYDALIQDPSDFWMRVFMPRIFKVLEPLKNLSDLADIKEMPSTPIVLIPYGKPEVQATLHTLMNVGTEVLKWSETVGAHVKQVVESGFPTSRGQGTCTFRYHR